MSYTVAPSENGVYLVCRVNGEITAEIARAFTEELDRQSRALNIKRFLNDVRNASNVLSTFENYNFAYHEMAQMKLQRDVRSAILVRPEDTSHDFVETVTQNAGYNVRVFRDEAAAIAWLSE
jgi:SpoIIAA-like